MAIREIVKIDEELCDGCGKCIPDCVEGALQLVNGKARLVKEIYCDGLGACLGSCPRGAISIERREAEEFDEQAANLYMEKKRQENTLPVTDSIRTSGCPGMAAVQLKPAPKPGSPDPAGSSSSSLGHWPVQMGLVSPEAPCFKNSELLLTADCAPVAIPDFHSRYLSGHSVALACPKLDNIQPHLDKLTAILIHGSLESIKILRMEVPCCSGLTRLAEAALLASGKDIPLEEIIIGIDGKEIPRTEELNALA